MTRLHRRALGGVSVAALSLAAGALAWPAVALARGGGGSAGFGGGGFRGGGGGFGGRGVGPLVGYGVGRHAAGIAAGLIVLIVVVVLAVVAASLIAAMRYRARRRERVRRVELAALEAAEDDPEFAPDVVHREVERIFREVESAWSVGDRERLGRLVGPDLMVEWNRRLDDFARRGWRNEVSIVSGPELEYVGLVNRPDDRDDRVCVRVSARLRDVVYDSYGNELMRGDVRSEVSTMCEYWTMGKRDGHWVLVSIEQQREGDHELDEAIVATPWGDTARLEERSMVEQAAAAKPAGDVTVAEVAPAELIGEARAAALDLSLVDGRFAPDVLAAEVGRAVEAWAEAVDGSDADLRRLASAGAAHQLLHPGDPSARTRLVVRGPHVRSVRIVALDARTEPATMTVELEVRGRRYVEDRDTAAVVAGSQATATTFHERWTLALNGDDDYPWRIVDAVATAAGR